MTKTDQETLIELGKAVGLTVRANGDGSVTYGNTRTFDSQRAGADILTLRRGGK